MNAYDLRRAFVHHTLKAETTKVETLEERQIQGEHVLRAGLAKSTIFARPRIPAAFKKA